MFISKMDLLMVLPQSFQSSSGGVEKIEEEGVILLNLFFK